MTAKSIIQVDVDDSQFKSFYGLFQEYQAKLEGMPDDWKGVGEAIGDAGAGMGEFSKATDASKDFLLIAATQAEVISKEIRAASASNNALLASLKTGTKAQKEFSDEAERGNKALSTMKKSADGVAHSIFGIGKFLLKLGAIGGGLAGLGGILSAISLKDLAASAVDTQRTARGLGMTPGQITAFNEDFGRYVDPGALGTIANQQGSLTGQMWLSRATGLGRSSVASQDPGQLASLLALKAHDWWVNTPESRRNSETFQTTGLSQSGFSFEMARQEGNTPRGELERAQSQYSGDQKRFNVSDQNTDSWYGFLRQIKDAGNTIESDLKNKLVALTPDLQRFIDVIGKDAKKLIDEIFTPKNLESLEGGINDLTNYLGSPKFGQDIKDFSAAVSEIASDAKSLASIINRIAHPFGDAGSGSTSGAQLLVDSTGAAVDLNAPSSGSAANQRMAKFASSVNSNGAGGAKKVWGWLMDYLGGKDNAAIASHLSRSGSDFEQALSGGMSDVIVAQAMAESSGRPNAVGPMTKSGQAKGLFQFTDDTAKTLGLKNSFDPIQSIDAAVRYDNQLMKRYGGDVRKALAAYNWGPGNLDKDIAKNGANWESHLPQETKNYLNKIVSAIAKRQPSNLNVTVTNNTSARVAVQANAAAAQ